jgi:DUF4097 and DUF4098 domain-containing protein YvlB
VLKKEALRLSRSLAVLAAAVVLGSACEITVDAGPYSAHEEKRFQVAGTPDLSLTTFDGSVEVRSWDRAEVLVEIEKRASDKTVAESIRVSAEQSGKAITIDVKRPDGVQAVFGFRVSPSARIVASVPRHCNLVVRSDDGSIRVERVDGRIALNSRDGSLRGIDLSGTIVARTGDGSMRFEDVSGALDLESGDGGARVSGRLQAVKLKTGDGSVEVRATDGSAMTDEWEIRTGDGGLRLELPDAFNANLDASTSDGSVRVVGFGEPTRAGRDGSSHGDLKRQLGAGGKLLRLRSNSGSITVKTP